MKRFTLLFALLLSFLGVTQVNADELTVYDGTATNVYLPLYGYYADTQGGISEFIIPSSDLTGLNGQTIKQMVFYLGTPAVASFGSASFNVYLEEVAGSNYDESSASQLTDNKTLVYVGALDATGTTMEIPFTTNYIYNGGNLLVAIEIGTKGSYKNAVFYGTTTSSNSGRYKYGSKSGREKFIPKTTFAYEDATSTATEGPELIVKDENGKVVSKRSYKLEPLNEINCNFGLATQGTTKTYTISNSGTKTLSYFIGELEFIQDPENPGNHTEILMSRGGEFYTIYNSNDSESGDLEPGATETITITLNNSIEPSDARNVFIGTIDDDALQSLPAEEQEYMQFYPMAYFSIQGTIRDENKVYLDFADGNMPEGWTDTPIGSWASGYGTAWTVSTGYISQSNNSANYERAFVSPLLNFTYGETILFETARYGSTGSSSSIKVEYSTDGSTWTAIGSAFTDDVYGSWTSRSVTIPTTEAKYIRFSGWYVHLRNIYGGQLPEGANFAIDKSSGSFGVAAIGEVAEQTFTVTNSGNAALPVTFTDDIDFYVAKTVTFTKPDSWTGDRLYIYAWDGSGSLTGDWPGLEVTEAAQNDMSQWVYTARLPKGATGIKFSDNASHETSDISTEGFEDVVGLWYDGNIHIWKNEDFSVPAKGSASFTVRMVTTTAGAKSGNIQLAFEALNAESPFTIPVSGVVMPDNAAVVDFNDNRLPENWTSTGAWNFKNGEAGATSAATMTTTAVEVSEGDFLVLKVRNYGSWNDDYVQVEAYDGTNWSVVKKIMSSEFYSSTEYTSLVVTGIPTTTKKLRFTAYYAYIDEIVGIKFATEPILAITTDAEGNTEIATGTTCDLGWVTTDAYATYYIKNKGTGTLTISGITVPAGITATTENSATTVAPGATLALTVAMTAADNDGAHVGTITIETDGGNFELPVSGVVRNTDKLYLDFSADDAAFPTGWSTGSWNIIGGTAKASGDLQTTTLVAAAGEKLVIEAISTASYYSTASLSYTIYSAEDNSVLVSSTALTSQLNTNSYSVIALDEIDPDEDTEVLVKFTGSNVSVRRIYGFTAVKVAVMETTAANIAFGMLTTESEEETFTISNTGEAVLTGLSVSLGKTGDEAEYSFRMTDSEDAEFTGTELAVGQTINVYVKQLFDVNKVGSKSDVLTIAADGQTTKTINLTGSTRDGSVLYVDFDEPNAFPEGWQVGANWSVYTYGTDRYAYQNNSKTASALVTTPLTVEDGQSLSFKVSRYASGSGYVTLLKLRYSQDGGATWSDYTTYYDSNDQNFGTSFTTKTIENLPTGNIIVEFFGNNIKLDMIQGLKVATAPALALTESGAAVENGSTKDFGNMATDATATYVLKNTGNSTLTSTITGEGVTVSPASVELAAGETAEIIVTMAFAAPYGEKTGKMTIESEGWVGDVVVNYTAEAVDPTDFVEDFAGNAKPAGWYSENWTYGNGVAYVNTGTAKPMITELVGAETGKNTLSFDTKFYYDYSTGAEQTLTVYTSTDRKNWTEAKTVTLTGDVQEVTLDALADGKYYVKFEAANAIVDNIKGVKRLDAPAHDLYEVSATMAVTGIPGASYTATVVGVSLRADEIVTAELWLKGDEYNKVAELTEQTMTVNTNKTFTLTGNLPDAEGEYKMWVTVKNDDTFFNTDEIDFTLTHTHTMAITTFPNAAAVQADDNNEYTGTFFVTVQNTGSAAIATNDVSVSLINNTDAESTFTSTWTAENSNVLYMNTKKDDTDIATDCTLKAWCWNTDTDGEWIAFTKVNDGFWSLDLNGKTNFIVCRFNPSGTDENPWNNVWNQSGDLSLGNGNLVKFNGYNENALTFTSESMSYLEPTMTTTLKVTVTGTLTDGENANVSFKAKENFSNTYYGNGLTSSVSVTAAPVIALDETTAPTEIATGTNRKVTLARKFAAGWNTICLPFEISDLTVFGENAVAYSFDDYDTVEEALTFNKVTTLTAATPYVIYVPEAINSTLTFRGVTIEDAYTTAGTSSDNDVYFRGTYAPVAAGEWTKQNNDDIIYGLTIDGHIMKAGANASVKGFRAYFDMPAGSEVKALTFDGEDATGIKILSDSPSKDENIYNIAGQRIQKMQKGINIVNGKKILK